MCGLVEVGENWFGFLYSWSDNKKKSSLMLSLFEPGKRAADDTKFIYCYESFFVSIFLTFFHLTAEEC